MSCTGLSTISTRRREPSSPSGARFGKDHRARVRPIMRALIVPVGFLALLPLDALAEGRRAELAVVDANGKQVGTAVGARVGDVTIALNVNGRHALLDV